MVTTQPEGEGDESTLRGVDLAETFSSEEDVTAAIRHRLSLLTGTNLATDPQFRGSHGLSEATRVRDELVVLGKIRRRMRAQVNVAYA